MEYRCDNFNIKLLSIISYIGPLFIIGRFSVEYSNETVKFHVKQGGMLFIALTFLYGITALLSAGFSWMPALFETIGFLAFVGITVFGAILIIMGISGAIKNQQRPLPILGVIEKAVENLF